MLNKLLNFYNQHTAKIIFISGLVIGLILGLVIGWGVWPVTYTRTTPEFLRQDFRDDYLAWVAREYASNRDVELARQRLGIEYWKKEDPLQVLEALAQGRGGQDAVNVQMLLEALRQPSEVPPREGGISWRSVLGLCGGVALAAALGLLVYFLLSRFLRGRRPSEEGIARAGASQQISERIEWDEALPPIAQFKTTYSLGDDHYDPSFSIESSSGDFLGECGVGISETIGVGDPRKVTALEVWLFDKNDIRTVTKVLMSEFAYNDQALQSKLSAKGETLLARPGTVLDLTTETLKLRARVIDMEYGVGQMPANSFFQRITLELGIWSLGTPLSADESLYAQY